MKHIKIALLGLGTVGTGVYSILSENKDNIQNKLGCSIEIAKILVRDTNKARGINISEAIVCTDPELIMNDTSIDIVVELMGGIDPAKAYILKAIEKGKHVVTANKALISQYGDEIAKAAEKSGVSVRYEASVCGGIPILSTLQESLSANRIQEVVGIVNGTTNYILTKMSNEKVDFKQALEEAQQKGYAEADPTSDIEGFDAMYKLLILAKLAFNKQAGQSLVYREGITNITINDIQYAEELGYKIKLLAIGKEDDGQIELRVHPTLVPKNHPLASVGDAYNAVFIKGSAVGDLMLYGKGAGSLPTGSAVVGDIMYLINHEINNLCKAYKLPLEANKSIKNMRDTKSIYYIRVIVKDIPGVLGRIATVFGKYHVSLASILQKDVGAMHVPIIFLTHETLEGHLQDAITEITGIPEVHTIGNIIRVDHL